jgi:hypothetical protein
MAKNVQCFTLIEALRAAGNKGLSAPEIANILGVKENSAAVYVCDLKKLYKAEIGTHKEGRKVLAYYLVNDKYEVPKDGRRSGPVIRKSAVVRKPEPKAKVAESSESAILDRDLDIAAISDREFGDIRSSLGLGNDFGFRSSDW